jgi:acyl-CoA thioesterase-1
MSMVENRGAGRAGAVWAGRGAGTAIALWVLFILGSSCSGGSSVDSRQRSAASSERPPAAEVPALRAPTHPPAAGTGASRKTILFVGTSITAGFGLEPDSAFPQLIDRKLDSLRLPYDAVNAGVSGETSAGLLRRIDWLLREPFDVVVIETGANDGLRGAPVATVRANIEQIVDRIKSSRPDAAILLVQMEALPNLGENYTSEFRAMFPELARRSDLTLLPFLLDGVAGHRELNQPDGIHPNMAGEHIVAENMWRALRPILDRRLQERPSSPAP